MTVSVGSWVRSDTVSEPTRSEREATHGVELGDGVLALRSANEDAAKTAFGADLALGLLTAYRDDR